MNVGLAQAAAALNATAKWQESIAENLSASAVPGYKKQETSFGAFAAGRLSGSGPTSKSVILPRAAGATNFQPGELKHTGVETDVGISGPGFLSVQLPSGQTGYTRDGELRVDASGQLVSKQGYVVLGEGGPIQLDLNNASKLSISASGEVSQGPEPRGKLQAVEFGSPQLLRNLGHGYFLADHPEVLGQDSTATTFRQGFLETSNTSAASEMANLITAMRIFEANQRSLQAHDERTSQAIRQFGGR